MTIHSPVIGSSLVGDLPTLTGGESIAWRVYQRGEARAIDAVGDDPDAYNPDTPVRSELHLPIGEYGILIAGSSSSAGSTTRTSSWARYWPAASRPRSSGPSGPSGSGPASANSRTRTSASSSSRASSATTSGTR